MRQQKLNEGNEHKLLLQTTQLEQNWQVTDCNTQFENITERRNMNAVTSHAIGKRPKF
jgi:hypothetical protein